MNNTFKHCNTVSSIINTNESKQLALYYTEFSYDPAALSVPVISTHIVLNIHIRLEYTLQLEYTICNSDNEMQCIDISFEPNYLPGCGEDVNTLCDFVRLDIGEYSILMCGFVRLQFGEDSNTLCGLLWLRLGEDFNSMCYAVRSGLERDSNSACGFVRIGLSDDYIFLCNMEWSGLGSDYRMLYGIKRTRIVQDCLTPTNDYLYHPTHVQQQVNVHFPDYEYFVLQVVIPESFLNSFDFIEESINYILIRHGIPLTNYITSVLGPYLTNIFDIIRNANILFHWFSMQVHVNLETLIMSYDFGRHFELLISSTIRCFRHYFQFSTSPFCSLPLTPSLSRLLACVNVCYVRVSKFLVFRA